MIICLLPYPTPQFDSDSLHRTSVPYNRTPHSEAGRPGIRSPIIWEQEGTGHAPFLLPLRGEKRPPVHAEGRFDHSGDLCPL